MGLYRCEKFIRGYCIAGLLALIAFSVACSKKDESKAQEGAPEQVKGCNISANVLAQAIWNRGVGSVTPADKPKLANMASLISEGKVYDAAGIAVGEARFIDGPLFQFADRLSNLEDQATNRKTSFTSFIQGLAKDNRSIKEALTADGLYVVDAQYNPPAISLANEDHWAFMTTANLRASQVLQWKQGPQWAGQPGVPADYNDYSGIATLSSISKIYFAGTNRAATQYYLDNWLCRPFEEAADGSIGDLYIGRDVSRADVAAFEGKCITCHGQGDAMRAAFAGLNSLNVNGYFQLTFSNSVDPKYAANSNVFPDGYVTTSKDWLNLFTGPQNAKAFGWHGPNAGTGVKPWAQLLAESDAFPRCMLERAVKLVWLKDAKTSPKIKKFIDDAATKMQASNTQTFTEVFRQVLSMPQCM